MAQPYNYSLNIPDPAASVMSGVQSGLGLQAVAAQRDAAKQAALEKQRAAEAQAAMQAELAALSQNPTPAAVAAMSIKYPQLSENLKRGYDMLGADQQQSRLSQVSQVYAALDADSPDVAKDLLARRLEALKGQGNEAEAKSTETILKLIDLDPKAAKTSSAMMLAAVMGPDKFTETFGKLQSERRAAALEPSQLSEAQSKAQKAAVDAKFAESNAVKDLEKKGWDITKIQEDIKVQKENSRIAALNAQIAREANQVKREEMGLKLEEMKQKRDDAIREKVSSVESARSQMDNMLNTADRILKTPAGVVSDATGPIYSRLPTTDAETANFEELVNTLGSQVFLAQVPMLKGTGNLSEKEGDKLQSSLQGLSLRQSPERLLENVREAQRLILKARSNLAKRNGVPESVPDTPQATIKGSGMSTDAMLRELGVM